MGTYLRIYPIDSKQDDEWVAFSLLEMPQNYNLFKAIQSIPPHPAIGTTLKGFSNNGFRGILEDAYGRLIIYVAAKQLHEVMRKGPITNWLWQAVNGYVGALPGNTPIALYWH